MPSTRESWNLPFKHIISGEKTNIFIKHQDTVNQILPLIQSRIRVALNMEPNTYDITFEDSQRQKRVLKNTNHRFNQICTEYVAFYIEPHHNRILFSDRVHFLLKKECAIRIQLWWKKICASEECPVCLNSGRVGRRTNYQCDHFICNECYVSWTNNNVNNRTCPTCRAESTAIIMMDPSNNEINNSNYNSTYVQDIINNIINNQNLNLIPHDDYIIT